MSKIDPAKIVAVVLAGGKATRMGGGDKPLRLLNGRTILAHTLDTITPQVGRVVLNANGDPERFVAYGLPVIADSVADFPGPLAGILAGLDWAATHMPGANDVVSIPGDCPFLPDDLVAHLHATRFTHSKPLACAGSGGWTHPVIGIWPVSIREELRRALAAGERKIDRFTARFGCVSADWPIDQRDPFFNVNTLDELIEAERLA